MLVQVTTYFIPPISQGLHEFLEENFPQLKHEKYSIEQEWTGIMGYTPDENPIIGKIDDGSYIAVGFSGHGMPRCN